MSTPSVEQARVYRLRMTLLAVLGRFSDAVKAGRAGLEIFGVTLPEAAEDQVVIGRELAEAAAALRDRRMEDLVHAPALDDPDLKAVLELLVES
jgi:predicted ATPase